MEDTTGNDVRIGPTGAWLAGQGGTPEAFLRMLRLHTAPAVHRAAVRASFRPIGRQPWAIEPSGIRCATGYILCIHNKMKRVRRPRIAAAIRGLLDLPSARRARNGAVNGNGCLSDARARFLLGGCRPGRIQ